MPKAGAMMPPSAPRRRAWPAKAARTLNLNLRLLYRWQKEALTPVAAARGAERRQLRALARRQAQELDILRNHRYLLRDRDPMRRYCFIEAQRENCPVRRLCQVLGVPASGY